MRGNREFRRLRNVAVVLVAAAAEALAEEHLAGAGNGLPGPRGREVPAAASAAAIVHLHGEDERQVPGEGPDAIDTGVGMPQFVNGDVMIKRALNLFASSKKGLTLEKARRTCIGACVGSYIPYETGHPVERAAEPGQGGRADDEQRLRSPHQEQIGPKSEIPKTFKDFEELYAAFERGWTVCEDTLRRGRMDREHTEPPNSARSPGAPSSPGDASRPAPRSGTVGPTIHGRPDRPSVAWTLPTR